MIEITDKRNCIGCGACVNACPHQIITMKEDDEGFIYPVIDKERCVDCHRCEKSCPMLKERSEISKSHSGFPQFYAGQLKNKADLLEVSSGGAFWAFSQMVIDEGGVVYGAVQKDVDHIYHIRALNVIDIKRIRRSKYFQSDIGTTFQQANNDLKKGMLVLFSGTGCQIAGLKAYLNKDYDNLITVEVVCHGVPSYKVWKAYRREKEEREGKRMIDLVFRDKSAGWSHNQYKITYEGGSVEKELSMKQLFHAGYLNGLFYRPSCGSCKFASLPRVADITLADYWKYKGRFREQEDDLGISLISINNEKGSSFLQLSSKYLDFELSGREQALASCRHFDEHPVANINRSAFFELFFKKGYYAAAKKYIKNSNNTNLIKKVVRRIWIIINQRR